MKEKAVTPLSRILNQRMAIKAVQTFLPFSNRKRSDPFKLLFKDQNLYPALIHN